MSAAQETRTDAGNREPGRPIDRYIYQHMLGPHISWPAARHQYIIARLSDNHPALNHRIQDLNQSLASYN